jgi:hypothetical protein
MVHELRDGVVWVRIGEPPEASVFVALLRQILADPDYPRPVSLLIDVRQAARGPSQHDMRTVADFLSHHRDEVGALGVLVRSKLQYGLARVGQLLSQNRDMEIEIFHDEATALTRMSPQPARALAE